MNGNKIFISSGTGTTPIAATKSDEINAICELIEKASSTQQAWKEYIAGRKEWSITVNWLVTQTSDIQKLLYIGGSYTLNIMARGDQSNTVLLTGTAICQQAKIVATRGNLVTGAFTFKGSGELAQPSQT